jgi:uncharacterized protein (TIGR03435 family)
MPSRSALAFCLVNALLRAQPAPHFEVVSIRLVPPNQPPILRDAGATSVHPGGQYIDQRTSISSLILFAYHIPAYFQLTGVPDWAKQQAYSIFAKPAPESPTLPPTENTDQVRLMMRALLEDRCHLKLHSEPRQEPVYHLELTKGGFKIQEVAPPVPPATETPVGFAFGNSGGRMIGKKATMIGIAKAIEPHLKRPIIDRTGLTGYYDFDISWSAPDPAADSTFGPDAIALLISILPDRLGLHLTRASEQVRYWIVDHVEPPTDN